MRTKITNTKMAKMDVSLFQEFQRIAAIRFAKGLDKSYSPPLVQRKMLNHLKWQEIRRDLEVANFIKDERAQYNFQEFGLIRFIVVAFIALMICAGMLYAMGLLNDAFQQVGIANEGGGRNASTVGYVNLTNAANITFGKVNESIQGIRLVALALIFAEIMMILVLNSFTKQHPFMFIVHIFITFLAVMLAAPVANSYEALLHSGVYGGTTLQTFGNSGWFLLNLPYVVLVLGTLGGIFMFINFARTDGSTL